MWHTIGQPKTVDLLKRSLESGYLSHAYLFVGPPHVGKMTLATDLARALNCEAEERPCGECNPCRAIAAQNHADIQIIGRTADGDSAEAGLRKEIGIGQIRELQRAANLKPYQGRCRVFIIDGAEYLNEEAANCLLKTLEEPPPNVVIILLATNDSRLLPTVVSRCQRVGLFPLPAPAIEGALVDHWGVEPEKARTLAWLCQGGIGWAISAWGDERLVEERSLKLNKLSRLANAGLGERFSYAAELATQFSKNRASVQEGLNLWSSWWRDLLLIKGGAARFITNIDHEPTLRKEAEWYSLSQIKDLILALREAARELEQNANPRLVLEVLMLSIPAERG